MEDQQAENARAVRVVELAREIKARAETPAEYGGEHQAAQSYLASLGAELADLILEALPSAGTRP